MPETVEKIKRLRFDEVFKRNADGSLTPRMIIRLGGLTFGPGVSFGPGIEFGGVNIYKYQTNDIGAIEENGTLVIKGFYSKPNNDK